MSFAAAGMAQREKSWYMLLFQFEGIAEEWLSADDWANLRAWVTRDGALPEPPDMDRWIADLSRPAALTAALGWYRSNLPPAALVGPQLELPAVQCPTMGVWSDGEFALTEAQMTGSAAHVEGLSARRATRSCAAPGTGCPSKPPMRWHASSSTSSASLHLDT